MNVRDLVELAALTVSDAKRLIQCERPLPAGALENYWTLSKCRHERWHGAFKAYHEQISGSSMAESRAAWHVVRPVVDEVLGSEILSRVWAAILCQRDARRGVAEAGPIAKSVLVGHYEARHRALGVLLLGHGSSIAESVQLNRLRRRYEQWIDLLLGALLPGCEVDDFAIELLRVKRFAAELSSHGGDALSAPTWQWIRATLRSSFLDHLLLRAPNADLNEGIGASVLALYGDVHDTLLGTFNPPWLARLKQASSDTRGNVLDLYFSAQRRRGIRTFFHSAHPRRR